MYNITHIHIQTSAVNTLSAQRAAELFDPGQIHRFETEPSIPEGSDPKKHLIISTHRSGLLKPCPCTSYYTGCGYTVFNCIHNCPLTCTYCILQAYLNEPGILVYGDLEHLEDEIRSKVLKPGLNLRIGTGQLGDSLALERISGISGRLIKVMASSGCSILELKTKTAAIEPILSIDPKGRTVVGWSVNASCIIQHEETHTASLEQRLKAACKVREAGYMISFHLDPVICFSGWEAEYGAMFDMIGDYMCSDTDVAWFSIGGMRFMPELKRIIDRRFPDSIAAAGEFIDGADGKKRYYKKTRARMFKTLYRRARKIFPNTPVYFCMESEQIWREAAGRYPGPEGLKDMLDRSVLR